MREIINYYYQFNIENLHLVKGIYHFTYQNNAYILKETNKHPQTILSLFQFFQRNFSIFKFYSKIILTKENMPFIIIDNKVYVLLLTSNLSCDYISFYDMKFLNAYIDEKSKNLLRFPWQNLWMNKSDYLENIILHTKSQLNSLLPTFYWYLGLAENAISYLNYALKTYRKDDRDNLVISHERVTIKMSLIDFYDPITVVIDHPSRDVSEYIKSLFLEDEYNMYEIEEYINSLNFSNLGFSLLYARIIYPSFFFDYLDDFFQEKITKEQLIAQLERIEEYRQFLKEIYFIIRKKSEIEEIRWIMR